MRAAAAEAAPERTVPGSRQRLSAAGVRSDALRTFTWMVTVPAVLVYLATCFLVFVTLHLMTTEINRIDEDRSRNAIEAAIAFAIEQLAGRASDESQWTEAYLNTHPRLDHAWLDDTWGSPARDGRHYDMVVVTDIGGDILFGESRGGRLSGNIAAHFEGGGVILEQVSQELGRSTESAPIAGLARWAQGISAIAVDAINGTSHQFSIAAADRRLLWFATAIDSSTLTGMAQRLQVPVPRFGNEAHARPEEQVLTLTGVDGTPLDALIWRPLRPGDSALTHTSGIALLVLVCLGILGLTALTAFRGSVERRAQVDARDWVNARFDASTCLLNRFGLEESMASVVPPKAGVVTLAVTYIEFEGLKGVTGNYGPQTAEALLKALAELIEGAAGREAEIARLGPDEFAICSSGRHAGERVRRLAQVVMEILAEAVAIGDLRLKLGASIGVAEADVAPRNVGEVIAMAAAAMQRARETGGNHVVEYEPSIEQSRQERLALQADIRHGLDAEEFDLVYQPVFDFSAGAMTGVEALLRWPRRPAGPLSPAEFIAAAETSGLIEELGLFALRRACTDIIDFPGIRLSVNVSTVQLRTPGLAGRIASVLAATGFPADLLQLEITESFLLAQPDRAKRVIDGLRAQGIAVALDDFGTGFASNGYLRQFHFDRMKLDRSLVSDIDQDPVKLALVESTMVFAYAMGLAVTAEGTERREEAAALTRLGCREFQGYLFSRPLPLEGLRRLLAAPSEEMKKSA